MLLVVQQVLFTCTGFASQTTNKCYVFVTVRITTQGLRSSNLRKV